MKKRLIILMVFSLFSFSFTEKPYTENKDGLGGWPCPQGYHFEVFEKFKLNLFKGAKTCTSGFGFCFGVTVTLTFDCVKNVANTTGGPSEATLSKAKYYPATDSADVIISQIDSSNLIFYFPDGVKNSPSHSSSDFDYFDTDSIVIDGIKLQKGVYPKVVKGKFYTYTVPFTYE